MSLGRDRKVTSIAVRVMILRYRDDFPNFADKRILEVEKRSERGRDEDGRKLTMMTGREGASRLHEEVTTSSGHLICATTQ
jgi:hypothetical protein